MRAREDSKVTNSGQARSPNQAALVQREMETFSKLLSRSHELELRHANATTPGASSPLASSSSLPDKNLRRNESDPPFRSV